MSRDDLSIEELRELRAAYLAKVTAIDQALEGREEGLTGEANVPHLRDAVRLEMCALELSATPVHAAPDRLECEVGPLLFDLVLELGDAAEQVQATLEGLSVLGPGRVRALFRYV